MNGLVLSARHREQCSHHTKFIFFPRHHKAAQHPQHWEYIYIQATTLEEDVVHEWILSDSLDHHLDLCKAATRPHPGLVTPPFVPACLWYRHADRLPTPRDAKQAPRGPVTRIGG